MNRNIPHVARMERFAVLRARYPEMDFDEIMGQIYEEEVEQAERDHYAMLDAQDEEREYRQAEAEGAERFMDKAYAAGNV